MTLIGLHFGIVAHMAEWANHVVRVKTKGSFHEETRLNRDMQPMAQGPNKWFCPGREEISKFFHFLIFKKYYTS